MSETETKQPGGTLFEGLSKSDVQDELNRKRAAIAEADRKNAEVLAGVFKAGADDGTVDVKMDADTVVDFRARNAQMKADRAVIEAAEEYLGLKEWIDTPQQAKGAGMWLPGQLPHAMEEAAKSIAEAFTDSEEFKRMMSAGRGTMDAPFLVKGKRLADALQRKDIYSALPSGTPGQFQVPMRDAILEPQRRATRVRDLFPQRRISTSLVEYIRMTGYTGGDTNAAAVVAERNSGNDDFESKPQTSLTFSGEQAAVRTIAHWEAIHRNTLADVPQVQGLIEDELLYGLRLEEDDQILNGDGTGDNFTGILNTTGVQTYAWDDSGSDETVDAIRRAMTLAYLAEYEPTGVVLNPADWEDIELTKDLNQNYTVAVSVAMGGQPRVWRAPVVQTQAIAAQTALVGAFGLGAQLYDREESNIRIAEQHGDLFIKNAVLMLAEQRLALAVKRPEAFVAVDLTPTP